MISHPTPLKGITLHINGKPYEAQAGQTVFAVLLANGILELRHALRDRDRHSRGGLCGMGVCQECRVTIDGVPDRRACMTEVREGMEVVVDGR